MTQVQTHDHFVPEDLFVGWCPECLESWVASEAAATPFVHPVELIADQIRMHMNETGHVAPEITVEFL